jgi:hypothetical protein
MAKESQKENLSYPIILKNSNKLKGFRNYMLFNLVNLSSIDEPFTRSFDTRDKFDIKEEIFDDNDSSRLNESYIQHEK